MPPRSHATTVGNNSRITTMTCVCLLVCVLCVHLCIYLRVTVCLVWLWSDTWCGCVVPPISAPRPPLPSSFYRKLIGGCHWCVKLLCVGRCRQLDYLFFIFSILGQLPSALLLFLNEILFRSVALKDTVYVIVPNRHMVGGLVFHLVMFDQKFLSPILWLPSLNKIMPKILI